MLREELAGMLRSLDALEEVADGSANFLLCHLAPGTMSVEELSGRCRAHGLFVRDLRSMSANPQLNAFRIAVKDRETNRRMVEILEGVLAGP